MKASTQRTHAILAVIWSLPLFTSLATAQVASSNEVPLNLAPAAKPVTSFVSGHETLSAIADDQNPRSSRDNRGGAYGNWPRRGTQWVEYVWEKPVSINSTEVYWWADGQGINFPQAARLSYWDGQKYTPISEVGVSENKYNTVKFDEITTTKLRLEFDGRGEFSTGILEWKVYDTGKSPAFPPTALAGEDRITVLPARTYLHGSGKGIRRPSDIAEGRWTKLGGPGEVTFANPSALNTSASFSAPGDYELQLTYRLRGLEATDTLKVKVEQKPAYAQKLNAVYVSSYKIDSPFWKNRLRNQILNWIPHCVAKNDDPKLVEGGINNLIEAGKKLRGEPAKPHVGYPFSNAWVLNTAEAMCVALTLDPQGDAEIIKKQQEFKAKLEDWIPIILAAQEKDGYFQTRYTLGTASEQRRGQTPKRWDPALRADHEGYIAGYFIEMGIAHHIATGGNDRRLYDAALKLADCWVNNIGPAPKQQWYDGHQEMEQALVRLGRYVNDLDGPGKGQKYIDLAKFLLDCRAGDGKTQPEGQTQDTEGDFYLGHAGEYDQSHRPISQQYTAVGHAVRAAYTYSAMADIAMETGDADYWSAIRSIWDNIVNRKYYVTGGIGSGETSEGFGPDYSLPNASAYVESCSSCGLLFMQYKLNLATRDAKYADLYETTLYNAILGDVDLEGQNFTYTNSLDSSQKRYKWHVCPCCVGNIPRTLLMLPTWMYATSNDDLFINLYAGSTVTAGKIGGTTVEIVQKTDYPWDGKVHITLNPKQAADFTVNLRAPRREVSELYAASPASDGMTSLMLNGELVDSKPDASGYVKIKRTWKAGDTLEFVLPLEVQTITPSDKVAATRGRVALQRGPLIYNIESVDQNVELLITPGAKFQPKWSPELLDGVMTIHGQFTDGSPLLAIPNYARLNRGGRSLVWIKK